MTVPTRGPDRVLRVAALSLSSLLLAGGAHVAGGGGTPPAPALVLGAALVIMVAAAVTARRCRLPLLLFVVGAEQVGLHVVFGAGAAGSASCAPMTPLAHHHGASCLSTTTTAADDATVAMGVAHLVVLLITVWLLSRGEAWLWSAADLIIEASLAALAPFPGRPAPLRLLEVGALGRARLALSPAAPRGPPAARRW